MTHALSFLTKMQFEYSACMAADGRTWTPKWHTLWTWACNLHNSV